MIDIPKTMKAWVAVRVGEPEDVLVLKPDWPTPAPPKTGEIMIRISYVALNPGDSKMVAMKIPFRKNTVAGMDFVGEVVQVGPSTSTSPVDIRVGMIVAGTVTIMKILHGAGTLADYLVVPAHSVVEKPEGLEESVAAGPLGIAGQTSAVVISAVNLHTGDKVLVNGASGGVGSILIQVLSAMGMHVTGICSSKNEALVRRLGAETVVDYTVHESLYDYLCSTSTAPGNSPFDAILDCVGNDTLYYRSPGYLSLRGKFLTISAGPFAYFSLKNWWPTILGGTPRSYASIFSSPSGSSAKVVVGWIEKGWIRELPVDSRFEMGDALQAFERLATQRTVGKVYVKVN